MWNRRRKSKEETKPLSTREAAPGGAHCSSRELFKENTALN